VIEDVADTSLYLTSSGLSLYPDGKKIAAVAPQEPNAPAVRVRYLEEDATFNGRIEARNLKPNFAYQIKVMATVDIDEGTFQYLGAYGRFQAPDMLNMDDSQFLAYDKKGDVTSFIFFDYLVTDENGNAARDFSMTHSLHVLWKDIQSKTQLANPDDIETFTVSASDAETYMLPDTSPKTVGIWAERERVRYDNPVGGVSFIPALLRAHLVLTEESFHSPEKVGGEWATPYYLPVMFTIMP